MAVAVHGVEVELGGVDHEVVIEVLRVRHRVEEAAAAVWGYLGLSAATDPGPGFGLLRRQLDRDAMGRNPVGPGLGRRDDAVVVARRDPQAV